MEIKAAVFRKVHEPLTIESVEIDKPWGREVLVRTAATGVCHSELHVVDGQGRWPLDRPDRLPEIQVPTLLVCGDEDRSLEPMRVMEQKIKGARLVLLSPASHFANRDQPEAFNRALVDFLADLRLSRP